jgi:N utilization substance protein A
MNTDLLRFIDSISRDKSIEKESVFVDLEAAMVSAARKAYDLADEVDVKIDRVTGDISAAVDGQPIDMKTLGRIAAQTAKQVMIQKIREDERNSIFEEFSQPSTSVERRLSFLGANRSRVKATRRASAFGR